jgi:chemotaxis protein MotB
MKLLSLQETVKEPPLNPFYISFSDLVVLLCVFFVMMLGMSKIDVGSFERIRTGITGSTKNTLVELANKLVKIAETPPGVPGVTVRLADDGVRLDLETAALFELGSAVLKREALQPLEPLLFEIRKTKYTIDIEGHTDDLPLFRKDGDELETNWSLSGRRASSFVHHLLDMNFKQERLRIVGYAATKPKAKILSKKGDALDTARARNRRVSLLVK